MALPPATGRCGGDGRGRQDANAGRGPT